MQPIYTHMHTHKTVYFKQIGGEKTLRYKLPIFPSPFPLDNAPCGSACVQAPVCKLISIHHCTCVCLCVLGRRANHSVGVWCVKARLCVIDLTVGCLRGQAKKAHYYPAFRKWEQKLGEVAHLRTYHPDDFFQLQPSFCQLCCAACFLVITRDRR